MTGARALRVFLYGTLLDPRVFRRMAGALRPLRGALPARLPGHCRVALRGTPYPTLLRGAGEVGGLLVTLPPAPFARLAAYEGASYRLVPVRVLTARGPRRARAWAAAPWRADPAQGWPA
ncbi:gamma-glutamylcyclotransferase family protein [Falsiroseomonas sp. CW058]|uniref:gamma-glutamylcyclotransferase family protein n=1 Tax=Falsiroseomonas sp. CW058 TaxID=3388664 RepID=UPI003D315DF2